MSRVAAWCALRSGSPTPLRQVDRFARQRDLDGRDTALARKLVGIEARHRGTLRAVAKVFLHRKVKPDVTAYLHLGLAQILFLDRIPPHAAVSETLRAVHDTIGPSKVHKVNAVLRNVLRALRDGSSGDSRQDLVGRPLHFDRPVFHSREEHELLWMEDALSMPAQITKRWAKRWGIEETERLARLAREEPPLVLRVLTGDVDEALAELMTAGVEARRLENSRSIQVAGDATEAALATESFQAGRWIVQGAWASRAADAVAAQPGERVLDLCAAPGGKSAVLAATGASVLALDLSPFRLRRVRANAERLGFEIPAVASDGTHALRPDAQFDAVLIDAPCTNTGVLAARPEARWRFGPASLSELTTLQARLLREGFEHVKPGGRLIWSTCSLEPEENTRLLDAFLEERTKVERSSFVEQRPEEDRSFDGGSFSVLLR